MEDLDAPRSGAPRPSAHLRHRALALGAAFCGCLAILYLMHLPLVPSEEQGGVPGVRPTAFDPLECSAPPLGCWDGARRALQRSDRACCPPGRCTWPGTWHPPALLPAGYNKRGGVFCLQPKSPVPLRGGRFTLQAGSCELCQLLRNPLPPCC